MAASEGLPAPRVATGLELSAVAMVAAALLAALVLRRVRTEPEEARGAENATRRLGGGEVGMAEG